MITRTRTARDLELLSRLAAAGELVTIAVTWRLWMPRDTPPNLPVIGAFGYVPYAPILVLAAVLAIARPRRGAPVLAGLLALAIVGDQTRLQPEVVSLAILMVVPLYGEGWVVARWHLATMWLWAGLHKALSLHWSTDGAAFIARSLHVPGSRPAIAVLLPIVECGLGVAAFTRRGRPVARVGGVVLHIAIVSTLVLGWWNSSVWAWNVVLAFASWWLFPTPRRIVESSIPSRVALAALALSPALFYAGAIDAYMAHNLYSGNTATAFVCTSDGACDNAVFETWDALNVPLPPEPRLYRAWFDAVCRPGTTLTVVGIATRLTDPPSKDRRACPRLGKETAAAVPHPAPTTTTAVAPPTTGATTTTTAPPGSVAGKVFVLDPGHNEGNAAHPDEINRQVDVVTQRKACDTTGTATNDGFSEAAFTTDVAARTAAVLRARGAIVVLTRDASTPWGPCIDERAAIGNDAHADAVVSIHADGGPSDGRGFHVIEPLPVAGHNEAIVEPSAALARLLRDVYLDRTGMPVSTYIGRDGIDARNDLGGLNLSTVPKVFIECGNMRNSTDAALLEDPAFRQRIAEAIAAALVAYVT